MLSVLLPSLAHLKIPNYPEKQEKLIPSVKDTAVAAKIFNFSLKVRSKAVVKELDKKDEK